MNTPTPVSALNTLTRPEKSASSKGSANDSGTSFSSALEQQKKTVSESEKPSGSARAPESGTEAPKENVAQRPDSQESKDESQDPGRTARHETSEKDTVSDKRNNDNQTEHDERSDTEGKQLAESEHARSSLDAVVQGLIPQTGEKTSGQPIASDSNPAQATNVIAAEKASRTAIAISDGNTRQAEIKSEKGAQATQSATREILSAVNEAAAGNQNGREIRVTNLQAAMNPAGAAIAGTHNRTGANQLQLLNGRIDAQRLEGARLERVEGTFARSENTSAFLDRVVEARRISGQQLLQNAMHSDIAAANTERATGGSEAVVPGLTMTNSQNTAFSLGSATVSTPVGSAQWGRDFSQQVSSFSQHLKNGLQTIELRLDPPDLGPIRISLSMSDNVAQASFVSPHGAVRHAVEQALPQLQEQLAQAGISLGQTSVGDQHQQGDQASAMPNAKAGSASSADAADTNDAAQPPIAAQRSHNGQVDTFA